MSHLGLRGIFTLSVHAEDDDGNLIPGSERSLPPFENLITDLGMEGLKKPAGFNPNYVQVGSGATPPDVTDTTLAALVVAKNGGNFSSGPSHLTDPEPYISATIQVVFAIGTAAGNLTEIGLGQNGTGNLFCRSLIKDGSGNPTTLTVSAIEVLTVMYEWRVYPDYDYTHEDKFTIDSVEYTLTTMLGQTLANNASSWLSYGAVSSNPVFAAYVGALGAAGAAPSNPTNPRDSTGSVLTPGPLGSYYWDIESTFSVSQGNGNLTAIQGPSSNTPPAMKFGIGPALTKTNLQTLTVKTRTVYARYVP